MNLTAEEWERIKQLGSRVGAPYHSVRRWDIWRTVPWRYRPLIAALAEKEGIRLPDDFLTFKTSAA